VREKVAISWSGGKDCTLALFETLRSNRYEVANLHTGFNVNTNRVGLHGIKQNLIEEQAKAIGIPLDKIFIPTADDHTAYEAAMNDYYKSLAKARIAKIVFGDIFLEDLKTYREKMLSKHGLEGVFPLWRKDSRTVAEKFIINGFKAIICAADAKYFVEEDVGLHYDLDFINTLKPSVDPCGENGEFHTFVYDGPLFKKPVSIEHHQTEAKEYSYRVNLPNGLSESRISKFWFQELS
jgi:uncharacterized protein (TIGR00290 family)